MKFSNLFTGIFGVIVGAVLVGGTTWVFASHDTNTIHACVANPGSQSQSQNMQGQGNAGSVRIVDSEEDCNEQQETPLEWNIVGPAGVNGMDGMDGTNGTDGVDGIDCWDLNGNHIDDPGEDTNGDSLFNALDCQGPPGADGADGMDGTNGTDGVDGIDCWDLNGNRTDDPGEDTNGDSLFNALDCQGPEGPQGPPTVTNISDVLTGGTGIRLGPSFVDIVSHEVTVSENAIVLVVANYNYQELTGGAASGTAQGLLAIDGLNRTGAFTQLQADGDGTEKNTMQMTFLGTPDPGTHTFTIRGNAPDNNWNATEAVLVVMELKR